MLKYEKLQKGTPYIVTRGNDSLYEGDVFAISENDGSMLVCPKKSDRLFEQGGWYDIDDLKNHPDILDIEAQVTDRYEFHVSHLGSGSEGITRKESAR